ncbi:hypothetical protein GF386_02255 [Candidatus Pacearchaeota archaeon]|nr:hypothetical protein [Candidatus Pacearchaeota archaeon]
MIMKKRGLFFIFLMIIMLNCFSVSAYLGMTPAKIRLDFEAGKKYFANFRAMGGRSEELEVYATGDFSEYVRFDRVNLTKDHRSFTAYIDLPEEASKPGPNVLYIKVREKVNESRRGIVTRLEVGAKIIIKVPYPGKYALIKTFEIRDVNEGEPTDIQLGVISLGYEDIYAIPEVLVYSDDELVDTFNLGGVHMKTNDEHLFTREIGGCYYKSGFYNSTALVDFGGKFKANRSTYLRVGTLHVDIIDWTKKVNNTGINKFFVEVESKWNNDLDNIYAEVNVSKDGNQVDFFKTPSIQLGRWKKEILEGFFNSDGLDVGYYKANITIFYNGESNSKIVDVEIVKPEGELFTVVIITTVVVLSLIAIIAITAFVVYILMKRSIKKSKKT